MITISESRFLNGCNLIGNNKIHWKISTKRTFANGFHIFRNHCISTPCDEFIRCRLDDGIAVSSGIIIRITTFHLNGFESCTHSEWIATYFLYTTWYCNRSNSRKPKSIRAKILQSLMKRYGC